MAIELSAGERHAFERLQRRLRTLLPPAYQDTYEAVQPVSMGSAGLKYADDGAVAWDQIWGSFCDLAMAGGPPHKGTLLAPGTEDEIDAQFGRYDAVVEEICRGIRLVTGRRAYPSITPGWISVTCTGDTMADWLLRAIVMENVAARRGGAVLELPAAPHFRIEKEIKNVITVIAKTTHYWAGHIPPAQQRKIGDVFMGMDAESPLLVPERWVEGGEESGVAEALGRHIGSSTGLRATARRPSGWLGVECPDVKSAVWMMRALVACNVLARREERVLLVPINPLLDPDGTRAVAAVARVHRYLMASGVH